MSNSPKVGKHPKRKAAIKKITDVVLEVAVEEVLPKAGPVGLLGGLFAKLLRKKD
jgi:hypothetical protein